MRISDPHPEIPNDLKDDSNHKFIIQETRRKVKKPLPAFNPEPPKINEQNANFLSETFWVASWSQHLQGVFNW